jgi:RNase H-fold protein (predicted Holliday junction resolvase)
MAGATILGISPGTRYMGIALQRNETLYEWQVKTYKGVWSEEKLLKVIDQIEHIIITHVVKHIACKIPHSARCSSGLKLLIEKIKAIAKEFKLQLHIYSITDLKDLFNSEIRNKKSLAFHIANKYPELTHIFLREKENKNQYHLKIFEAVAAIIHCHNSMR